MLLKVICKTGLVINNTVERIHLIVKESRATLETRKREVNCVSFSRGQIWKVLLPSQIIYLQISKQKTGGNYRLSLLFTTFLQPQPALTVLHLKLICVGRSQRDGQPTGTSLSELLIPQPPTGMDPGQGTHRIYLERIIVQKMGNNDGRRGGRRRKLWKYIFTIQNAIEIPVLIKNSNRRC